MNLAKTVLIFGILLILFMALAFHMGAVYGTKVTAGRWTKYIMEKCVRVDLLMNRIETTFRNAAEQAPEGTPVVIAQDSLIKLITDVIEVQNR